MSKLPFFYWVRWTGRSGARSTWHVRDDHARSRAMLCGRRVPRTAEMVSQLSVKDSATPQSKLCVTCMRIHYG